MRRRTFKVVLIKPSRYDDDGYVVQWWRTNIPSNSLASIYGLIADCAAQQALGPDVCIDIEAYEEGNVVIDVKRAIRRIRAAGSGFVGLVGVQSNQYPRALDIARQCRAAGMPVVIGGFHVTGSLAMLPRPVPELQEALDLGVTLFAGEAEGRMAALLRDIDRGRTKPIYDYVGELPGMDGAEKPMLPRHVITRTLTHYTSFDAGRGCPFQCSFCTIINVQGRKSRHRTADDVEAIVRANAAQGITHFLITDDNFARNRNWEAILDRLILLRRRDKLRIVLILQVDTLCHRIPGFVDKAARAGCNTVFIGLENINPDSLSGAKKRQNRIWEYRELLMAWRRRGILTYAGYILGFPADTPASIARDIDIIKRELPVDILEFFFLTPLPGSEDHKKLALRGEPMEADLNKYDLEHPCTAHPRMSKEEWEAAYADAWARYYSDAHVETLIRRCMACGIHPARIWHTLTLFSGGTRIEGVHPLQIGLFRRKVRKQRRPGMPRVNPLLFYPWRVFDLLRAITQWLRLALRYRRILARVTADPAARAYTDQALATQPNGDARDEVVSLFAERAPPSRAAAG